MAKKLFVGNLPWSATNDDLQQAFSQHGAVSSASILTDKMTGRSRGFGFVEMENDAEAEAAIAALNGTDMGGRKIIVNEARPMTDRPQRSGGFGGGGRGGYGGGRGGNGGGYGGGHGGHQGGNDRW